MARNNRSCEVTSIAASFIYSSSRQDISSVSSIWQSPQLRLDGIGPFCWTQCAALNGSQHLIPVTSSILRNPANASKLIISNRLSITMIGTAVDTAICFSISTLMGSFLIVGLAQTCYSCLGGMHDTSCSQEIAFTASSTADTNLRVAPNCCRYRANCQSTIGSLETSAFRSAHFLQRSTSYIYFLVVLGALPSNTVCTSDTRNSFKVGSVSSAKADHSSC